jgi:two-component system response regulator AtoC
VFDAIRRVAPTDTTVLVTGETGTGKELVARAVHDHSSRRQGSFLAVNCAAFAESLRESELFGHLRGAFTGAVADKPGLFEAATAGTLFLDEIGDMSLGLQQRLLRVLQEREVRHVGAVRSTPVDVRIVAATRRDLRKQVTDGLFREDLFYRLNVFTIELPPLRDRIADVPLLVESSLARLRGARRRLTCSPLAMRMLRSYAWPGNVRELLAAMESASIRADGERIDAQHLPAEIRSAEAGHPPINGDRYRSSAAAEIMGMGRTTLWRKMRQHRIADATGFELSS